MYGEPAPRRPRRGRYGRDRLVTDLRRLGVQPAQDLLVHCSLRQVGWIDGGAATLLNAVLDVAGQEATLVVPTHTTLNSLSSNAFLAATASLDVAGRARFIAGMPGFDPTNTPSTGMGALAEYVRTRPAATRSSHPQVSFAALGPNARACTAVHDLDCHLGERSPLGWLYAADAAILLLGVGYSACTALHLAEYRLPTVRPLRSYHCFTTEQGVRAEREFTDIDLDDSDFELLGAELDAKPIVRQGQVGSAECRLLALRAAVDFGCTWLEAHRRRVVS
jgi:aminoglycoside N3'-acetyltransferase